MSNSSKYTPTLNTLLMVKNLAVLKTPGFVGVKEVVGRGEVIFIFKEGA